jgi:hypothetical protein
MNTKIPTIIKPANNLKNIGNDKIGDAMFKFGEIIEKLDYNIADITKLKIDCQNNINLLDQTLDRVQNIETSVASHRDIVTNNVQDTSLIRNTLVTTIDKLETLELNTTNFITGLSNNIDTNNSKLVNIDKILIDVEEQLLELNKKYNSITLVIKDLEATIPNVNDIMTRVYNIPLLKSIEVYESTMKINKELYISYDLYVRNKSLNEFLDNYLDRREYFIDKEDIRLKLNTLEETLNNKIDNRFSIVTRGIKERPSDKLLSLEDGKLLCYSNEINFRHDFLVKIGEKQLIYDVNGFLGVGVINPKYNIDSIGKINSELGFYQNGKQVVSSQWSFNFGSLNYLESPVCVDILKLNTRLCIKSLLGMNFLATNLDGELYGYTKINMSNIDLLEQTINDIKLSIQSLSNNNFFDRGITLGDNINFISNNLEFRNDQDKTIFKISKNGELEIPSLHSNMLKKIEIKAGKLITTPIYKSHNINLLTNNLVTIMNNNILILDKYYCSKLLIGNNIELDSGLFIINYSDKNTNLHLFDTRLIQCSYMDGIIIQVVKNENLALALLENGGIVYKKNGDIVWRELEYLPKVTNVVDIEASESNIIVVSKDSGVFYSNDGISWTSIKNIIDIKPIFYKNIGNIAFIYGTSIDNGSSIIYMLDNNTTKRLKLPSQFLMSQFCKNTLISISNTYIIATSSGEILMLNNLYEWELYSESLKGNNIIDIIYYDEYYYIYLENLGIIKSPDLFEIQNSNYLSQFKRSKFSNFAIYNNNLIIAQRNIVFTLKNKIWTKTIYNNLQNIDYLYSYNIYKNYSIIDTKLQVYPDSIYLIFDQVVIVSKDLGENWEISSRDQIPEYYNSQLLDDITTITIFKDYDIEINTINKLLTIFYKNSKNFRNTIHFREEYGRLFYICYPDTIILTGDFNIVSNNNQYAQLLFKEY